MHRIKGLGKNPKKKKSDVESSSGPAHSAATAKWPLSAPPNTHRPGPAKKETNGECFPLREISKVSSTPQPRFGSPDVQSWTRGNEQAPPLPRAFTMPVGKKTYRGVVTGAPPLLVAPGLAAGLQVPSHLESATKANDAGSISDSLDSNDGIPSISSGEEAELLEVKQSIKNRVRSEASASNLGPQQISIPHGRPRSQYGDIVDAGIEWHRQEMRRAAEGNGSQFGFAEESPVAPPSQDMSNTVEGNGDQSESPEESPVAPHDREAHRERPPLPEFVFPLPPAGNDSQVAGHFHILPTEYEAGEKASLAEASSRYSSDGNDLDVDRGNLDRPLTSTRDRCPTPPGLFGRRATFATENERVASESVAGIREFATTATFEKEVTSSLADNSDSGTTSVNHIGSSDEINVENTYHQPMRHPRYNHSFTYADQSAGSANVTPEDTYGRAGYPADLQEETSAQDATATRRHKYEHPAPLQFTHNHPFKTASVSEGASSVNDFSVRSDGNEGCVGSGSLRERQRDNSAPRGLDHTYQSSTWLSTVEEGPSEPCSSPGKGSFNKATYLGPHGNITGTPHGTGMKKVGSSLADASSPTEKPTANVSTSMQTYESQNPTQLTTSDSTAFPTISTSSHAGEVIVPYHPPVNNAHLATPSSGQSSSDQNGADNSAAYRGHQSLGLWPPPMVMERQPAYGDGIRPETPEELAHEPVDWAAAYRRYLPPLGANPVFPERQVINVIQSANTGIRCPTNPSGAFHDGSNSANAGSSSLSKSKGPILHTSLASPSTLSSEGCPILNTVSNVPFSLHHPRYVNGLLFTDCPVPEHIHPIYGHGRPPAVVTRRIDRPRMPPIRASSPHLFPHRYVADTESRQRERKISIAFAVLSCIIYFFAPLYAYGFLDRVMFHWSNGEFLCFRGCDKVAVKVWLYGVPLVLLVVAFPLCMIIYAH